MLLCKKIKLEVSEEDAQALEFMQAKCRGLYNWWIMRLRDGEKWPGWKEAKATLQESNKKKSKRYIHLTKVYKRVSEQKRNKQKDSLHKASYLISHKLVESTVVVGDLSQRQMVTKQHQEKNKHRNRAVFNEWGCYTFVQMLVYKCLLYGKDLEIISEKYTSKDCHRCGNRQAMPLWKRTYHCERCGVVMDRDENSAHNILERFLARLGPHVADATRCADVFTAIDNVNTFRKAVK